MKETIVLAYSGGLDTSVAIKWIEKKYHAQVITVTLDIGQLKDMKAIEKKALITGSVKHVSIDAKKEFAKSYIFPAIKANALYEDKYPVSTALSRPLIASKLVEIANDYGATGVAHGCTGKGNDQVRFEVTIKSLEPNLKIIAPIRDWGLTRTDEIKFAKENGIPISKSQSKYSIDQNLWGRAIECGVLEQSDYEPPEEIFEWTSSPENAPNEPEYVTLEFKNGVPRAINGKITDPVKLIERLNEIAGKHGIGRIDHIEDRLIGIKSREVYECPAATVLIEAHKDLEKLVLTRHEISFKKFVDDKWTFLVYNGLWLEPLRNDLEAFINEIQKRVSGKVRIKLYKGSLRVVGRSSPMSLYDPDLATYSKETAFDQRWAAGFIELWGFPTKIANILQRRKKH